MTYPKIEGDSGAELLFPHIRNHMNVFFRKDMEESRKFYGEARLWFGDGKFQLDVNSADSSSYSEHWEASSMEELEHMCEKYECGMIEGDE